MVPYQSKSNTKSRLESTDAAVVVVVDGIVEDRWCVEDIYECERARWQSNNGASDDDEKMAS